MTIDQHRTSISLQIAQQAINTLTESFAKQSAEFDICKEKLAAVEAKLAEAEKKLAEFNPKAEATNTPV